MYIEDNPDDAVLIQFMVEDIAEFESITIVNRLKEGIALANEEEFDLAFLDLSLPDSHGVDTVLEFSENHQDIPLIVFTGLNDEEMAIEAINSGAQDYLVKGEITGNILRKTSFYALERFRKEQELSLLKNNLNKAESLANFGSFEFFSDFSKPILSDGLKRIFEIKDVEHIKSFEDLYPFLMKEGIEMLKTAINNRVSISDASQLEFFIISETSKLKRVGMQLEFKQNELKTVQSIFGTIRDVTENYQSSQRLKESEEKLLEAQSLAKIGSWEYYFYDNQILGSPEAYKIFEIDDQTQRDPSSIVDLIDWGQDAVKIYNTVKDNLNSNEPFSLELNLTTPKRNKKYIKVTARVYKDNQFKGHVMRGTVQDITLLKEAEEYKKEFTKYLELEVQERTAELEDVKAQLEDSLAKERELGELKSRFVSTASHQFRTPLTVIQSSVGLLEMQLSEMPEKTKSLVVKTSKRVNNQIDRMTSLMNDILILGKIEAGSVQPTFEEVGIVELFNGICQEFNSIQEDQREIKLEVTGEISNICTDSVLLEHIVMNLISNAFKYSKGAESPKFRLNFEATQICVEVADKGIGIDSKELRGIFEPFFRGRNAVGIAGTGLGTAIIKEYSQLLGGTISVTSEINKGSLFTLKLPKNGKNIDS